MTSTQQKGKGVLQFQVYVFSFSRFNMTLHLMCIHCRYETTVTKLIALRKLNGVTKSLFVFRIRYIEIYSKYGCLLLQYVTV